MRWFLLLCCALLAASSSLPALAQDTSDTIPGEFIVRLTPDASPDALAAETNGALAFELVKPLSRRLGIWLVRYDVSRADADAALRTLRTRPGVALAQENHRVSLRASTPDDERFDEMWGLNNTGQTGGTPDADVDAPEAWDLTRGGTSAHGDEIVVAVVDSGFDLSHPDLDFWKNEAEIPGNGVDDDENGYVDDYDGWNAYTSSGTITSEFHGHHVSGTVAARGNNELGVVGVNWGAKVMPIQGSSGNEATVIEAYGYAYELRATYNETDGADGAFVVATNASFGVDFGDPANYPIWCGFYDDLGAVGILSAGATANIGIDIDTQGDVPTACASDYMIAVTNMTHNDTKNNGAAFGATTIDLGAPGTSVLSTVPGGGYSTATGTSMATPHVAGATALMVAGFSGERLQAYKDNPGDVILDVKAALLDGTDPIDGLVTVSGGRLNLYNSLLETFDDDAKSTAIGTSQTIADATFEGENVYVLDGTLLTLEGDITLQADAQGTPSYLYVIGQLDDTEANVTLLDGSQIIFRDGSSPILPTPLPGPGTALTFDGNASVTVLDGDDLPTTGAFTVSMWMRAETLEGGEPTLLQQGRDDEVLYRLDLVEIDEAWHFRYTHTSAAGDVEYVFEDLAVEVGQPYHVALDRALSPDALRLYVGGERVGGTYLLPTLPDEVSDPTFVIAGTEGEGFVGLLDEVRVHDISLRSAVSGTIHETLEDEQLDSVVAYFRMEGEDAFAVFDYSPQGNHAVGSGTAVAASPFPVGQVGTLLEDPGDAAQVGVAGASLEASLTTADGDDPSLALYAYDTPLDIVVLSDQELLPEDITARSAIVWGTYGRGEVTADLAIDYSSIPNEAVPVGDRRLLFRPTPDLDWIDVTALWAHDADARRFVAGDVETFGEWAVGFTGFFTSDEAGATRSTDYALSAAYPNPFHGTAAFSLDLAEAQHVTVEVFDVLGRRVARLHDGPLSAGEPHQFTLDGRSLPSGLYVVRATGETFSASETATRIR